MPSESVNSIRSNKLISCSDNPTAFLYSSEPVPYRNPISSILFLYPIISPSGPTDKSAAFNKSNSSEKYSLKYYAEQVLDVYKVALADVDSDKSFFGRIKGVVKGGFHGK